MKTILLSVMMMLSIASFTQTALTSESCSKIETAAKEGALVFVHEGKLYLVSLADYDLYDIYTGDIRFRNYSDKKKKPKRMEREWDLMLMTRRVKYTILK